MHEIRRSIDHATNFLGPENSRQFPRCLGKGRSSKWISRRLSILLKKNRNADMRVSTVIESAQRQPSLVESGYVPGCGHRGQRHRSFGTGREEAETPVRT
jgi:hypothetical protein